MFHRSDCSEETFRQFRDWLTPRMPVVFVSNILDNDLQEVSEGIAGFVEFFDARRKKLDGRLRRSLGVA